MAQMQTMHLGSPLSQLFFAINRYVTTGDHFGTGVAFPDDREHLTILIPIRRTSAEDRSNLNCLISRISELGVIVRQLPDPDTGDHEFETWGFVIKEDDDLILQLARDLRDRPGALGWGSIKKIFDENKWRWEKYEN